MTFDLGHLYFNRDRALVRIIGFSSYGGFARDTITVRIESHAIVGPPIGAKYDVMADTGRVVPGKNSPLDLVREA